jgi:thiol-disulfide isomerase/thioredoxin
MDTLLLGSRLLLAAIFVTAAVTKVLDRGGTRKALADFGLPRGVIPVAAMLLPFVEFVVGFALVDPELAWWGAVGALGLLQIFVVAIGVNLARGRAPSCHCFGQLHSAPAGWPTLLRNGALAAVAAFVVGAGRVNAGPSVPGWLDRLAPGQGWVLLGLAVAVALIAVQGLFLARLHRRSALLADRIEALEHGGMVMPTADDGNDERAGLPVGAVAPSFLLPDLVGRPWTLDAMRGDGKPVMLIFVDPYCEPCNAFLPEVSRWQRDYDDRLVIAVVSQGDVEENRPKADESGVARLLLQDGREVADAFEANVTPMAVVVDPDGLVASRAARGPDRIRTLLARTLGTPIPTFRPAHAARGAGQDEVALRLGDRAPGIRLPSLSGGIVDLADFVGTKTLVLFWSPDCGFCARILGVLKVWEMRQTENGPRLLVVSTGGIEENEAQGFRATVVLDEGFAVGERYGASGTPSAVLVSEDGLIASRLAEGVDDVLRLVGFKAPRSAVAAE